MGIRLCCASMPALEQQHVALSALNSVSFACRSWLNKHGKHLAPPKCGIPRGLYLFLPCHAMPCHVSMLNVCTTCHRLHTSVTRVIGTWFELVDEDGSGGLDSSELASALKVFSMLFVCLCLFVGYIVPAVLQLSTCQRVVELHWAYIITHLAVAHR